jgi:hypothetical protein
MTSLTPLSKLLIAGIVLGSGATALKTYGARSKLGVRAP